MFLIPSHIRKVLQSVLTENAHEGPHTALLLLAHGQVLCTASNADPDWYSSGSAGDDDGDDDGGSDDDDEDGDEDDEDDEDSRGEGGEDDEDEPYIPTPERNRMLRGIVKSQLLETDAFPDRSVPGAKKERGSIKIECDLGRLLLHPLAIPIPTPSSSSTSTSNSSTTPHHHHSYSHPHPDPRIKHLTSIPNLSPQSLTYTLSAVGVEEQDQQDQTMVGNGKRSNEREGVVVLVLNGIKSLEWDVLERAAKAFEEDFRTKKTS